MVYRPGEFAAASGVFLVRHITQHRAPHEALIIRGEEFPICRTCRGSVRYEFVREIAHIHHDWDLAGPLPEPARKVLEFESVRAVPRTEVNLPIVLVEVPDSKQPVIGHGHAVNLSEKGMGAVIDSNLTHWRKRVLIRFPRLYAPQDIALQARLRYRKGMHHGFEFVRISANDREAIRELCAKRAP